MKSRSEILRHIVLFEGDIYALSNELIKYDWDIDTPSLCINKEDLFTTLSKFINQQISFSIIEDWANILEGREDIDYENEKIKELIYELANPLLFGALTNNKLIQMSSSL